MSFGYQRFYKGTHLLLQAIRDIRSTSIFCLIRGVANRDYADLLNRIIQKDNLEKTVDCKFGYVSDQELEIIFKASDIVILPYLEGSQSGVLFMAYAFGKPVIASDIGGFKDYIISGKTGELFDLGDPHSLKKVIAHVRLNYSAYRENFIKKYAYENYSWRLFAEEITKNIYNKEPVIYLY